MPRGKVPTELSVAQRDAVLTQYPGKSCVTIGKEVGLSRDVVGGFLKRRGLYLGFKRRAFISVNQRFFDGWSEDMAYVLGFMYADGSVGEYQKKDSDGRRKRTLPYSSITSKDVQILEDIAEKMGLKTSPCPFERDGKTYFLLTTSCRWVFEKWLELGVIPRKTYEGMRIPDVPESELSHFVRGFFDGDGSRSVDGYSVSFGCADLNFLDWLADRILEVVFGRKPTLSKDKARDFWRLPFYADRARKLYEWMKPTENGLRLERKWQPVEIA